MRRFEEHGVTSIRLRGGRQVWLVDVSPHGASFESTSRLVPGATVQLHVTTRDREVTATGRVVHCSVTRVEADGVWYRKGVAFGQPIEWPTTSMTASTADPYDAAGTG